MNISRGALAPGSHDQQRQPDAGACRLMLEELAMSSPPILGSPPGFDAMSGPPQTSGKAVASLTLGFFSLFCSFLTGIPAIIFGILGLSDIKHSGGRVSGWGMAVAGIVLGSVGAALSTIAILIALLLPAVQAAREAARRVRTMNQLEVVGMALQAYASTTGNEELPPQFLASADGKPLLSWRVLILPHLEEAALYERFKRDEPWDSPHNRQLIANMPDMFGSPNDSENDGTRTSIVAVSGPGTPWPGAKAHSLSDVRNAQGNKILLVVLADTGIVWTEPRDVTMDQLKNILEGPEQGGPRLPSVRGMLCLFADMHVEMLPSDTPWETIEGMLTSGGEQNAEAP
jgi:type II secretory pathway pseudopilin PulG